MLKLFRNIFLLLVVIISFQIWLHGNSSDLSDMRANNIIEVNEVKIAILWPFSQTGTPPAFIREGAELAIEQINGRGGLRGKPLRAIYFDNHGEIKRNADLSRKISHDVSFNAVFGSYFSSLAIDTLVATESKNLFYVIIGAEAPALTGYSFQTAIRPHFTASDYLHSLANLFYCKQYKNLAIVMDQTDYSVVSAAVLTKAFMDFGGGDVTARIVPTWASDFRSVLAEDIIEQADAIYVTVSFEQLPQLLQQVREFGIKADIFGDPGLILNGIPEVLGPNGDGLFILSPLKSMAAWSVDANNQNRGQSPVPVEPEKGAVAEIFYQSFLNKYGKNPDMWAREIYDGLLLYSEAVNNTGTLEAKALFSYIRFKEDWELAKGKVRFTPAGDLARESFYTLQIQDGAFVLPDGDTPVQSCQP